MFIKIVIYMDYFYITVQAVMKNTGKYWSASFLCGYS